MIMTINHLGVTLSGLTFEPFGFITAATGFTLLSGYMYAFTSPAKAPTLGTLAAQSRTRAAKIYRYHIGLFILLLLPTLLSTVYRDYLNYLYPANENALVALAYGAILVHQPPFMHILPLYLVMSLLSPLMLMALHRGRDALVLGLSITIWIIGQSFDPLKWLTTITGIGASAGQFNLFGWQLLWVAGLYAGFLHRVRNQTVFFRRSIYFYVAVAIAIGFFLFRHEIFPAPAGLEFYVENSDLRLLRVINTISQIVIFCYLIKYVPVTRGLPWLRFLGKYSLQVFTYHVVIVCLLAPISWRIGPRFGLVAEFIYTVVVLASMSLPALFYRAYEARQRQNSDRPTWIRKGIAVKTLAQQLFRFGRNKATVVLASTKVAEPSRERM